MIIMIWMMMMVQSVFSGKNDAICTEVYFIDCCHELESISDFVPKALILSKQLNDIRVTRMMLFDKPPNQTVSIPDFPTQASGAPIFLGKDFVLFLGCAVKKISGLVWLPFIDIRNIQIVDQRDLDLRSNHLLFFIEGRRSNHTSSIPWQLSWQRLGIFSPSPRLSICHL